MGDCGRTEQLRSPGFIPLTKCGRYLPRFSNAMTIYTIGHSTRSFDDLLTLLREFGIATIADVRRFPGSRRYPHFSREHLQSALVEAGVEYLHLERLGGRRKASPDSPNTNWKNESFRGYADHMASQEFRLGIEDLLAAKEPSVIMCAEAVPWRCHRNMIADELTRRGLEVVHILGTGSSKLHKINEAAVDAGDHVIYPASPQTSLHF